jgi:hypothetical protein
VAHEGLLYDGKSTAVIVTANEFGLVIFTTASAVELAGDIRCVGVGDAVATMVSARGVAASPSAFDPEAKEIAHENP